MKYIQGQSALYPGTSNTILAAPGEWTGGPSRYMWQWDVDFGRISCAGGILLVYTQPVEKSTILHPKIYKPNV